MATLQLPNVCLMCGSSNLLPGSSFCKHCFPLMFPKATKMMKNLDKVSATDFRSIRANACNFAEGALQNLTVQQLGAAVRRSILSAEADYRSTLFYPSDKPTFTGKANGFKTTGMMCFKAAADETPATAIVKFFQGETICECHSLLMAVLYRAILSLVGAKSFAGQRFRDARRHRRFGSAARPQNLRKSGWTRQN